MSTIPDLRISDYDYNLPLEAIATYPSDKREESKLIYYNSADGEIKHQIFKEIVELIPKHSLLLINSTKVIAARLLMKKPSSGKCELLLIDSINPSKDPVIAMTATSNCIWKCMIGGKNVNEGLVLNTSFNNLFDLKAKVLRRYENYGEIEFTWSGGISFAELLAECGKIPLPPYLDRDTEDIDTVRYQTVYARSSGSVAAPTAGLHFTDNILSDLSKNGVLISEITLHVGPGTFLPVSSDSIRNHIMHDEQVFITKSTISAILNNIVNNKDIIAVGTTSVRTIETLYLLGLKIILKHDFDICDFLVEQDEPYKLTLESNSISSTEAIKAVLEMMSIRELNYISGRTKLFIVPGYQFRIINGIITNFHLPKSTLLLLISAFAGDDIWRKVYKIALLNNYKFLSYGDASFYFKPL